ncbi:MAG: DUF2845 domain-containing protein [Pseudomonadota bacterium]
MALLLGLAGLALPGKAHAFRCGNKLVVEGDTAGAVLAKCGQPTEVTHKSIQRPPIIWRNGRYLRVPGGNLEVTVEIWTYNLGSNKLMQRLRLEDGEVRQIENLGYGYN